jgi:hypothetical protein
VRCPYSGKRGVAPYGEALAALEALASGGEMHGPFGSIYTCLNCEQFHSSSRVFTLGKARVRVISGAATWDAERAAELARRAYRYVAATYPEDAPLEPLGRADSAVVEAEEHGDWDAYVLALRRMMRMAKREAIRRGKAA